MGARRMLTTPCGGAIHSAIHQTHRLHSSQGLLWCRACGAFSSRWPRQLIQQCPRRPRSAAQRNVLRRLTAGMAPTTADYLRDVATARGIPENSVDRVYEVATGTSSDPIYQNAMTQSTHDPISRHSADHLRTASVAVQRVAPRLGDVASGAPLIDACSEPRGAAIPRLTAPKPHCYRRLEERMRDRADLGTTSGPAASSGQVPSGPDGQRLQSKGRGACRSHSVSTCVLDVCARSPSSGHWSSNISIGAARNFIRCSACSAQTRLRCKSCLQGLCMECAKADSPCASTVPQHPSSTGAGQAQFARRRFRGKSAPTAHRNQVIAAPAPPCPADSSRGRASSRHRHSHGGNVEAHPSDAGYVKPPADERAGSFDGHDHRRRHHHHGTEATTQHAENAALESSEAVLQ